MYRVTNDIFNAIKNDDVQLFSSSYDKIEDVYFRFGRFPLLSVMYLYRAKKLISRYEEKFLNLDFSKFSVHNDFYDDLPKNTEISSYFAKKAGKCLRLYVYDVVSPLEMLLILDQTSKLKKIFPFTRPTASIKKRLQEIYDIKYGLDVKYDNGEILLDRRPFTYREKNHIVISLISTLLCVAIAVSTPFIVNAFLPFIGLQNPDDTDTDAGTDTDTDTGTDTDSTTPTEPTSPSTPSSPSTPTTPKYYNVSTADEINFSSIDVYTLTSDVTISADTDLSSATCTIKGDGHEITIDQSVNGGTMSGTIQNATINYDNAHSSLFSTMSGTMNNVTINCSFTNKNPIFTYVTGRLENVTINVTANATLMDSTAFVTTQNVGIILNCTLNVSGNVVAYQENSGNTLYLAGVALLNGHTSTLISSYVQDCVINYDEFTLSGNSYANATFSGLACENYSYLTQNTVTGQITADTVDLVGVCYQNSHTITSCENKATLTQTTTSNEWNPIVVGIVSLNYSIVNSCVTSANLYSSNLGATLDVESEYNTVCMGISYMSNGRIYNCVNKGTITANGQSHTAVYASGIVGFSYYTKVNLCVNLGEITATSDGKVVLGGIASEGYSSFEQCYNSGKLTARGDICYVGGLLAFSSSASSSSYVYFGSVSNSVCESKITAGGNTVYVGGIVGYLTEEYSTLNVNNVPTEKYFGGYVKNNYFLGSIECENGVLGGIMGVTGKNLSDNNHEEIYGNFNDNYYLENTADLAVGSLTTDGETFFDGNDVGSQKASRAIITNLENYKSVMNSLQSLLPSTSGGTTV